jgi:predicted porin
MNKKLVALAVAGAFALPLAAQAQTANVTLYGRANIDLEFVKGAQPNNTNPTVTRISSNSSRFGLRGTEQISGNLSAFFQLENSVSWDGNGGTIAGRETFAGLQGSWGQVWLGRALSPYDDIHPIFGDVPTLATGILGTATLWSNDGNNAGSATQGGSGNSGPTLGVYDDRYSNSIRYNSATFSGFNFEVQGYTLENTGHGWAIIPALFYNNGPIQAGVAYAAHNKLRCYTSMAANAPYQSCGAGSSNGAVPVGGFAANDSATSVAGAYDFGIVRVALHYEYLKYETPSGNLTRAMYGGSLTAPLGGGTGYFYIGKAEDGRGGASDTSTRIVSLAHGNGTGAYMWELSYSYNLSKRTMLYTGYVRLNNESNANYSWNVNNYSVTAGAKPQGLVFGFVHFF